MIYLMNSAVMPAGCYGTYRYAPATVEDLKAVVRGEHGEWLSAIGYPQNLQLIEVWTGIQPPLGRIEIHLVDGDEAFVMRLKTRMKDPGTKGASVSAEPTDWEFAWVGFSE